MTTVEFERLKNREKYGIDPSEYNDEEMKAIDMILKVAEGAEEIATLLKGR